VQMTQADIMWSLFIAVQSDILEKYLLLCKTYLFLLYSNHVKTLGRYQTKM